VTSRAPTGWLIGVLSAAVAVGVGEFAAAFVRSAAAPLIAVGNGLIVLTPDSWKRPAIESVGTDDKLLLILGIMVSLAIFGAGIGALAIRNIRGGLAGVGVLGGFAVFCAVIAKGSHASDVVPSIVGTVASAGVLVVLVRLATGTIRPEAADVERTPDRRTFLLGGVASAALAAAAGFGGRAAQHARFDVAAARRRVRIPSAADSVAKQAAASDLARSGVPWATPNRDFYRIDTALTVPQISPDSWRLRIHGMVDREMALSWADLQARPMIDRWITLCCVSNPVGGPLVGNALFHGTRLADLLREVGLHPDAGQLLLGSYDGYTFGAPAAVVMDGRDALLAIGMNGEPLPVEHGFPVRAVVPGLYGYVSACKWIVDIKATTFADDEAYWVQGGWAAKPSIELESRIDTPRPNTVVQAGRQVAIAGVAWDQHVGVSKIEVQVDDGAWQRAELATVPSADTWRQWYLPWTPDGPGAHTLRVRATDARGRAQSEQRHQPFPAGATGFHEVTVQAVSTS
jgi:DMSO/TMAO reductase YedYZ molybdopterin-dependent catalytic subunit